MAGQRYRKEQLNSILKILAELFETNQVNSWFIAYGTLLGIVRENSCIDYDDDVDIVCSKNEVGKIQQILKDNNIVIDSNWNTEHFFRTMKTNEYGPVDFYVASVNNDGDFYDEWEKVIWSQCFKQDDINSKTFIQFNWDNVKLNLPYDYEKKLENRYGTDWKIPKRSKGIVPKKSIL